MIIHNPILTGSFTVNGTDVSSITSSAASLTSLNSYTASQNNRNGTYATTGSNTFAGVQTVNSNLVVTGSITAQTLVVQTVTSSVIYSSGSNVFGNNIANTQVFTGSMNLTGSLTVTTTGTEFQVNANGVKFGNVIGDAHSITGSVGVSGSATFVGSVTAGQFIAGGGGSTGGVYAYLSTSTNGLPATSGTTQTAGALRLRGGDNAVLDFGLNSVDTWIQATDLSSLGTYYKILLNPRGGNVAIGMSNPDQKLTINQGIGAINQGIPATSGTTQNGILRLRPGVGVYGETLDFGMNVGPSYGWIQSTNASGLNSNYNLALNPNGGSVLIGHTTDGGYKLDVRSSSGNNFVQSYTQISTNGQQCGFVANSLWSGSERGVTWAMYKHGSITNPATYISFWSGTSTFQYMHMDDSGVLRLSSSSGDIGTANGTIVGTQTSDIRLKNVKESFNYGLNEILQINPIAFTFKNDINNTDKLGFSAQEMLNIIPESVYNTNNCIDGYDDTDDSMVKIPKSNDNVYGMDYTTLIPVLVKAIQELKAEIDELKNK